MTDKVWYEFQKNVDKVGGCELWNGRGYGDKGYGLFKSGDLMVLAHRYAFEHYTGVQPTERVLQSCGNKRCVKEEHLSEEERKVPQRFNLQ